MLNYLKNKLDGYPYRQDKVQIGNNEIEGLDSNKIKESIDSIFLFIEYIKKEKNNIKSKFIINDILAISIIHYLFEIIHPYYDFNGRMGRILLIWCAKLFGVNDLIFFQKLLIYLKISYIITLF